ncbi:hypothetical protein RISW2_13625 [Roseivivax isoporae LMG 25204]|uniref:Uncharacterized protein n=1 Tax=Roseivivax isoporae LMG 25204 TaxID=1449351 RepID=X7F3I1_9RHOB|nr:hypothetical protein RISW2_13625 [Roseivivax isoporae LMG 25204]
MLVVSVTKASLAEGFATFLSIHDVVDIQATAPMR